MNACAHMKQEVNVHGLVLGKVLVKKFILYRDTVILAMQARNRFLE
jgi:hypothetical protein